MAPGACRSISRVARSIFSFGVKLEDKTPPASELDSSSDEGLAILEAE
jgi:hypothetical protein